MELQERPPLIFRCCSSTSAGDLMSGKQLPDHPSRGLERAALQAEFERHLDLDNKESTALVSTTTNFLRVLQIAHQKQWEKEDAADIRIYFVLPRAATNSTFHAASTLAGEIGLSEEQVNNFKNEYVFEWEIPDGSVMHRVSLATVQRRGFELRDSFTKIENFPNVSEFRQLVANMSTEMCLYDRASWCGIAACAFGFHAPLTELAHEIFRWTLRRGVRYNPDIRDAAIRDVLEMYTESIVDNLQEYDVDFEDLSWELADLHDCHVDNVGELVYAFSDEPVRLDELLRNEGDRYLQSKKTTLRAIDDLWVKIGC